MDSQLSASDSCTIVIYNNIQTSPMKALDPSKPVFYVFGICTPESDERFTGQWSSDCYVGLLNIIPLGASLVPI